MFVHHYLWAADWEDFSVTLKNGCKSLSSGPRSFSSQDNIGDFRSSRSHMTQYTKIDKRFFSLIKCNKNEQMYWELNSRILYYAKARLRRSELLWNVSCWWVPEITFYFRPFRPIQPILAWADWTVCASLSGLWEKRKKYSIGKLGYTSVRAEISRKWNSTTAEVARGWLNWYMEL